MQAQFWLERWAKGETAFHEVDGNTYLRQHWQKLSLSTATTVFVPLCGKSQDLWWLQDLGHSVVGCELAARAADDFFAQHGVVPAKADYSHGVRYAAGRVAIFCCDFFVLEQADLMDAAAWFDRAALVALPPEMRAAYAEKMCEWFRGDATGLLVTMEYEQTQMKGPPFAVSEQEVMRLYGARYRVELIERRDVLSENARFAERGVLHLHECAYRLIAR